MLHTPIGSVFTTYVLNHVSQSSRRYPPGTLPTYILMSLLPRGRYESADVSTPMTYMYLAVTGPSRFGRLQRLLEVLAWTWVRVHSIYIYILLLCVHPTVFCYPHFSFRVLGIFG